MFFFYCENMVAFHLVAIEVVFINRAGKSILLVITCVRWFRASLDSTVSQGIS
jgi:hypothetical protein